MKAEMAKETQGVRYAEVDRETGKTTVRVVMNLDGGDRCDIATGIGFLDQLLAEFALDGYFDLGVQAEGDWGVDDHRTLEEVGSVMGEAFRQALGSLPVENHGSGHFVVNDALTLVAVDVKGRGQLHWDVAFRREAIGRMATESIREFFAAFSASARVTLHVREVASENDHHLCESIFRGVGRTLHQATRQSDRHPSKVRAN